MPLPHHVSCIPFLLEQPGTTNQELIALPGELRKYGSRYICNNGSRLDCLGRRVIEVCNPRGSSGQRTLCCRPVWIGYRPLIKADLESFFRFEGCAPGWSADWLHISLLQHQPFFGKPESSWTLWSYRCLPGQVWWQNILVVPRDIVVAEIICHNHHNVWLGRGRTNVEGCEAKNQRDHHFKHLAFIAARFIPFPWIQYSSLSYPDCN